MYNSFFSFGNELLLNQTFSVYIEHFVGSHVIDYKGKTFIALILLLVSDDGDTFHAKHAHTHIHTYIHAHTGTYTRITNVLAYTACKLY